MKHVTFSWQTVLLCLGLVLSLAACERQNHTVRYEVGGTSTDVGLHYRNESGATEQRDVNPPWQFEFQALTGEYVTVSAFNKTLEGSVSCRIYVDGVLLEEGESVGGLKLVGCDGLIGLAATPTP